MFTKLRTALSKLKNKKQFIVTLCGIVLTLVLITDLLYHVYQSLADTTDTQPVKESTVLAKLYSNAYIVRSEKEVYSPMTGNVKYNVANGERVGKDDVVAGVYYKSGGNKSLIFTLNELNSKKSALTIASRSFKETTTTGIDARIAGVMERMDTLVQQGNISDANAQRDYLRQLICIKEGALGHLDITNALTQCQVDIEKVENEIKEAQYNVPAEESGWFYYECDGYENRVNTDGITSFSPTAAEKLFLPLSEEEQSYAEEAIIKNNVTTGQGPITQPMDTENEDDDELEIYKQPSRIGKLVNSQTWYVLCLIDKELTQYLNVGKEYMCELGSYEFSMKLEKIAFDESDKRLLILSCDDIVTGFDYKRIQSISIVYKTYNGYKIPSCALRYVDGQSGVYIRRGFLVQFCCVDPVFTQNGMTVVNSDSKGISGKYRYLNENDSVIIRGSNLYAGKIIKH